MDIDRVSRLLRDIERTLNVIEEIVDVDLSVFIADVRSRYALRYAIVELVEATATLGLHILREDLNIERVESYSQIFDKLVENSIISVDTGERMKKVVRLRNLIVHRYWDVEDTRIYREARESGIEVVKRFIEEVKSYVSRRRAGEA
ncbi:MAG: DUF86 domain-containing protein [Sulfolobales archaeon]